MSVHVNDQVLEGFLVHLKVLHDYIVGQPVSLVEVLPIVQEMVCVLFADPVNLDTVQVKRQEEKHGETGRGVDVTTDVLVIEGDVNPRTSSR